MKKLIVKSFLSFAILLSITNYLLPVIYADQDCSDDLYYIDPDQSFCIHKSEGSLDENNECVYNFQEADTNNCASSNAETDNQPHLSIPSSTDPNTLTTDEQALANLDNGTLPPELAGNVKPETGGNFLTNLINQFLGFLLRQPITFVLRSDLQNQTQIPEEVQPDPSTEPIQRASENLGKDTGIYSINIPDEVQPDKKDPKTRDYEKTYEQSNFPEGIHPITGQN
jgi:hypothetical protein